MRGQGIGLIAPPTPFVPAALGGLVLDLDPRYGIALGTGSAVASWTDQAGGNTVSQSTTSARPTLNTSDANFNGMPSLSFASASSQCLNLSSFTISQPFTAYAVAKYATLPTNSAIFSGTSSIVWGYENGGSSWAMYAGTGKTASGADTNPHVFGYCYDSATTNSFMFVDSSSNPKISAVNCGTNALTGLSVGGSTIYFNGSLARLLIYSGHHTFGAMRQVFRYSAGLYRLSAS